MVAPIIAAGARAAAGAAGRRTAAGAGARGAAARTEETLVQGGQQMTRRHGIQTTPSAELKAKAELAANDDERISGTAAGFMMGTAALIDLTQAFLNLTVVLAVASTLLTMLSACIFGLWFFIQGVSYMEGSKAFAKLFSVVGGISVELVPIVNALPATSFSVLVIILLSRAEDRELAEKSREQVSESLSSVRGRLTPANDTARMAEAA